MGDNTHQPPAASPRGTSPITIRRTLPTGTLVDTPADQLWLGLHELVDDDAACDLFDAAARMAGRKPGAEALN